MRIPQVYVPTTAQEIEHAEHIRYQVMLAVRDEATRQRVKVSERQAEHLARAAVLSYLSAMEDTRH
jgi:hypothetical protein